MEENSMNADIAAIEQTKKTNPFWPFIPAGITWFIGLLFLQGVDYIFIWWTMVCGWFPFYYAMKRKYHAANKKWNIANGFAITLLIVVPVVLSIMYIIFR